MSSAVAKSPELEEEGEPVWEIARLFPNQGAWSEAEYLALNTNNLVEFSNGYIEVLPMPTTSHQLIVLFLYDALRVFALSAKIGTVLVAPLRIRLWPGKYREPDVVFMLSQNFARMGEEFWEGADLLMEVVSDKGRRRDLEIKRQEYAQAGIPEYWIVDPQERRITVLRLIGEAYVVHGEFLLGTRASSVILPDFSIDVGEAFAAGERR